MIQGSDTYITTYNYNSLNRLTETVTTLDDVTSESAAYAYDNSGNMLTKTVTPYVSGVPQTPYAALSNSYDNFNQLITSVTSDGYTVNNIYNGEGLRVQKTVNGTATKYLYEYDKAVSEYDSQNDQTARNIYGLNLLMRIAANTYYYMYNGHADVTALLNAGTGAVDGTYYYDAFGNVISRTGTVNNSILYAGYQYDAETGLYYLNARMYDPVTARFLQEDTYRGNPNDPLSLNLYTYCANNPLIYCDPTGHSWLSNIANWANKNIIDPAKTVSHAMTKTVKQAYGTIASAASRTKEFVINNKAAIGTAAVAAGAIALGAATMGTSVVVSGALFGFGIGIGMTEASDFADNGQYDTSLRTYAANGIGGAVAGAMLPAVSGLSAIGRIAAYSAIGTTSDVSTQIIGSGSVDWGQAAAGGMKFAAAAMGIEALAVGAGALSNAARNISNKIGMQRFKGFLADETGGVSIGSAGKAAEGTSKAFEINGTVVKNGNVSADMRKFTEYIFKDGAAPGKDVVYKNLGYSMENSEALTKNYVEQAMTKYKNGQYQINGDPTQYGQKINIEIELPGIGDAAGKTSYLKSGWMIRQDGSITLNTPFSGFTK